MTLQGYILLASFHTTTIFFTHRFQLCLSDTDSQTLCVKKTPYFGDFPLVVVPVVAYTPICRQVVQSSRLSRPAARCLVSTSVCVAGLLVSPTLILCQPKIAWGSYRSQFKHLWFNVQRIRSVSLPHRHWSVSFTNK